jgi:hypothetical protein
MLKPALPQLTKTPSLRLNLMTDILNKDDRSGAQPQLAGEAGQARLKRHASLRGKPK